ncbi:hypothetical protein DL93DRAFT_2156815 [Clavulina sp. PMI_390]|nr:hypothetical protein DL93DRAFT_2156815 [Clavulina sp. PMI_390]
MISGPANDRVFRSVLEVQLDDHHGGRYCEGTRNNGSKYYCGDIRLGPVKLRKKLLLSGILEEYDRIGMLTSAQCLTGWWNATARCWRYPPQYGLQLDISGNPIVGYQALSVGLFVDRFGSERGRFLAPADTPYSQHLLPPLNLDTPTTGTVYPHSYHVYRVVNSFVVLSGPIAPWFGQPDQGVQYASDMTMSDLILAGYINPRTSPMSVVLEREIQVQILKR